MLLVHSIKATPETSIVRTLFAQGFPPYWPLHSDHWCTMQVALILPFSTLDSLLCLWCHWLCVIVMFCCNVIRFTCAVVFLWCHYDVVFNVCNIFLWCYCDVVLFWCQCGFFSCCCCGIPVTVTLFSCDVTVTCHYVSPCVLYSVMSLHFVIGSLYCHCDALIEWEDCNLWPCISVLSVVRWRWWKVERMWEGEGGQGGGYTMSNPFCFFFLSDSSGR